MFIEDVEQFYSLLPETTLLSASVQFILNFNLQWFVIRYLLFCGQEFS